ncbi:MAG: methionine--tRNA ligase [Acidobacteriaceae bacterium]
MSDIPSFYITTPIYYVNARPHIGHAYTTIVADAIARRKRALGFDTWLLTGTDEHGQKIERSAQAAGQTPQEFATLVSSQFRALWDRMGLTYDDYIRTTEERHRKGVQKLWTTLKDRGFIYKGSYTGQYCVSDELYVDAPPGAPCPDCGRITETVSEENYFFKLSAFERRLLEFYEQHPEFIQPEGSRNEVISFVRSGLRDLSISRTSFDWGIPVPGDPKHVIYVWMDALANYITALGYGSDLPEDQQRFARYWPATLQLVGKEIVRFHCIYWPAFLMAAELPLPKAVAANGWLLFEQSKMSKSRGNVVRAETILSTLGPDALRYFLMREVVFGQDGSFSFDALVQRYNADLANGYGNLTSRVLAMITQYFDGIVPAGESEPRVVAAAEAAAREFAERFDTLDFSRALESLWGLVAVVDGYITEKAPWKLGAAADGIERRASILYTCAQALGIITALAYPVMPDATAKIWAQLGLGDIARADLKQVHWGQLAPGTRLAPAGAVFPRAEKDTVKKMEELESGGTGKSVAAEGVTAPTPADQAAALAASQATREIREKTPATMTPAASVGVASPGPATAAKPGTITIDEFAKVDLRVGQVQVAERIKGADRLLRLEVNIGEEVRQIVAGIAEAYEPEKLIGRKVVIVANLQPRKLRGLESNGMIVAASLGEKGKPVLAGFLEDIEIGARLK